MTKKNQLELHLDTGLGRDLVLFTIHYLVFHNKLPAMPKMVQQEIMPKVRLKLNAWLSKS